MYENSTPSLRRNSLMGGPRNWNLQNAPPHGATILPFIATELVVAVSHDRSRSNVCQRDSLVDSLELATFLRQLLVFFTVIDNAARWNSAQSGEECQVSREMAQLGLDRLTALSKKGSRLEQARMVLMVDLAGGILFEWLPAEDWLSEPYSGQPGPLRGPRR